MQGLLKLLYNAIGGVRKGMCEFQLVWSADRANKDGLFVNFFRLGFFKDPQV